MDLNSVYSEIKQTLSISDEDFDLERNINRIFKSEPEENKLEIVGDILSFINKFSLFKEIKPFMSSLYSSINNTLEIRLDNVFDFEDLLIKNSIMHFIQEYINYSQLTQKDQVLEYLSNSLEKLQTQPLIMNLGLLLKPVYEDITYLNKLKKVNPIEVTYNLNNETELQIKKDIDTWLKSQSISIDNQEGLREQLNIEFNRLLLKYNLTKEAEKSKRIHLEVMEMLTMHLTMLSLMGHIPADSIESIPIK